MRASGNIGQEAPARPAGEGGTIMSELNTEKKAAEWSDGIPDPEEELPEPYEETHRDGSARHECGPED